MLVSIKDQNIPVIIDLRYATKNNICSQILYQQDYSLLHPEAMEKLITASNLANKQGLKLKIWDAYRPLQVQQFMYDFFASDKKLQSFFSDPNTGSIPHCRGIAVDLTLTNQDGVELNMGSDFDELSELANHNYPNICDEIQKNRLILLGIMTISGFDFYSKEWWHYQLFKPREYPVIRLS